MPTPQGDITTTQIWTKPEGEVGPTLEEAIVEADAEEAVEEYLPDEVVEE